MVISLRGVQHIVARRTRNRLVSGRISPEFLGYTYSQKPKHPAKAGRLGCCGGYIGERSIQVLVFVFVTSLSVEYTELRYVASIFWTNLKKSCGKTVY